jgi:hypothetical protein
MKTKRFIGIPCETPEARKDKISNLKKAIREGTYQIRADEIATKSLKELLLELALNPKGCRYQSFSGN